jgi:hypothetical protein
MAGRTSILHADIITPSSPVPNSRPASRPASLGSSDGTQTHTPSNANVDEDLVHNSAGPSNAGTGIHDSVDVHQGVRPVSGDDGDTSKESGKRAKSIDTSGPFDEDVRVSVHSTPE